MHALIPPGVQESKRDVQLDMTFESQLQGGRQNPTRMARTRLNRSRNKLSNGKLVLTKPEREAIRVIVIEEW
jgi:hypothetical protein